MSFFLLNHFLNKMEKLKMVVIFRNVKQKVNWDNIFSKALIEGTEITRAGTVRVAEHKEFYTKLFFHKKFFYHIFLTHDFQI